ncbi:hypothetical protein SDC9_143638 [bioreactor metagenome]|uniref:Uncharacterized protein n=1 Tax=bioreactor metagenome TaxID=1076179 RepID=A0A645E4N8_9ZZZZ
MKVEVIKENSFFKVHLKKIYFIIITLLALALCLISKSACAILFIVSFADDAIYIISPDYTKKIYEKDLYIKAALLGTLLGFIVENKEAFSSYFIS